MTIEARAKALFLHNHPDAQPALAELAWADPNIRAFWKAEVSFILGTTDE